MKQQRTITWGEGAIGIRWYCVYHVVVWICLACLLTMTAHAGTTYIYDDDSGYYDEDGYHNPSSSSTLSGKYRVSGRWSSWNEEGRGFQVFSIPSSLTYAYRTVTSIQLGPGSWSWNIPSGSTETFKARHVSTPISTLTAGGSGLTSIFDDLGGGTTYATFSFSSSVSPQQAELSSSTRSEIVSKAGGQWAVGYHMTSIDWSTSDREYIYPYFRLRVVYADAYPSLYSAVIYARVGTSESGQVRVRNGGSSGSTLTGTISPATHARISSTGGDQAFSLAYNESAYRTFSYTPVARGSDHDVINVPNNRYSTSILYVSGYGVGPVAAFSGLSSSSTTTVSSVLLNSTSTTAVAVSNVSSDYDAGVPSRTDLSVVSVGFSGPDASLFECSLLPGTVISKSGSRGFDIRFAPTGASGSGYKTATLSITTDENVPKGIVGETHTFELEAFANTAPTAVPGGPYTVYPNQSVQLTASASSDPDTAHGDSIVLYEWDLQSDGAMDATGATTLFQAGRSLGNRTVNLRVTDSHGAMDEATTTVSVIAAPPSLFLFK